ncbi:hypothetical protein H112_08877 [Trichophyton rubrum D6]|uniref:Uncharacterized protein n=3 Tax=Trichophyton TaxID=5550 RepID=F2SCE7_TRIRC|nr:uncharacterized protein TERG_01429 [Trichophyton rubrum CBS 118892]EZF09856.1 hypothetical protein H100_08898 [Trichophyton rubrum MR850]EZF36718.1 hypothetical protein H102_08859 [Trichophyton rubrum CBS 100081]EZF47310.1 hypothetical protein H103_08881 [Trichophyton rubrum CBS 288.86]EZF58048.1 hypothetical protein H104_08829 [Trichophyton rubrum CBS 289.86]EZF68554.1 hypothetical protein H105_08885 [Trichophyton soudanense CBS 452.61]EZF79266.1 hypothetical protein H110_08882 [Trichophy
MCGLFNSALAGGRLPSIRQPAGEKLATKARMEEKLNVRKHKRYAKYEVLLLCGIRCFLVEIPANNIWNIWRQTRHQPSDSFALSAVADAYDGCSVSSPLCLSRSKPSQRVARHFGPWALDDPSFHFLSIQVCAHEQHMYPFVASPSWGDSRRVGRLAAWLITVEGQLESIAATFKDFKRRHDASGR